jgi:cellobiose-specific phosphotransferase system component IIC
MPYPHLGRPRIKYDSPVPPAVSPPYTFTVPANEIRRILGIHVVYSMGATATIRVPEIWLVTPDSKLLCGVVSSRTLQANQSMIWFVGIGNGVVENPNVGEVTAPLFDVLILPSWQIRFILANAQTGDRITEIDILSEVWTV